MKRPFTLFAHSLALAVIVSTAAFGGEAPNGYFFKNFNGPNSGGGTVANAINNEDAIVGVSTSTSGALTNFIRQPDGSFITLNIYGTAPIMANGINDFFDVVGSESTSAFLFHLDNTTLIPPVTATTTSEVAFGTSDKGAIVGQYTDSSTGLTPGFLYALSTFTTLTPVSPVDNVLVVNAQDVNNKGLVVGFYSTETTPVIDGNTAQHGFLYDSKTGTYSFPPDPAKPNFFTVQLLGINDENLVAGYWQDTAGNQHGLLYDVETQKYVFLDDPAQAPINGITITQITGINNENNLTGFYVGADGLNHGFIATRGYGW
jgi:hypothetical protein